MGLEKRTVGSMGTSMTTEGALSSVREVGKESSPGCAASSSGTNAEPEGFKRKYGMGSRKYMVCNRWKRARKGLLHKERWDSAETLN